jgi:polyphosphate kinase
MEKETGLSSNPAVYFNRDLSWVDFNERVLEEALRKDLPLFERFRFLAIVASNFDEFFMVRVAAIKRAQRAGFSGDPSGLSPAEQLKKIFEKIRSINRRTLDCLFNDIFPSLAAGGLELVRPDSYTVPQMDYLESFFLGQIFPVLTPLRIEEDKPLPFFDSRCINAAFLLTAEDAKPEENAAERIVMVPFPPSLSRIVWLPPEGNKLRWALLDDMMLIWGAYLFPGYHVQESMLFKVNRDADFSVDERRDEDFIEAMEEVIKSQKKSEVVRIVYSPGSDRLRDELAKRLSLAGDDLYEYDGPFNASNLLELSNVAGFEQFQEKPWKIHPAPGFTDDVSIWDRLSQGDIMLHFPYQSFDPVVRFFQEAAVDPQVISIKTALYRTGGSAGNPQAISPIVRALEQAALNGKHVTALVELKARFDEERNISWANRLERAGVIVIYGLARLKVHAKICQVIRREEAGLVRYLHFSTGNYNDKTARLYSDLSLFSSREDFGHDATILFNLLTGYSAPLPMRSLVIAPRHLKQRLIELIDREAKRAKEGLAGRITAKMNALVDNDVADALYRASKAGVKINLNIRGICTLVPGLPGLSENIKVVSIVDHFLEHSRIFYFNNGGAEEFFISSADWMPRNLERRVELLIPVQDEAVREELRAMLEAYFKDNVQTWILDSEGNWERAVPQDGEQIFRAQEYLQNRAEKAAEQPWKAPREFTIRRSAPEQVL